MQDGKGMVAENLMDSIFINKSTTLNESFKPKNIYDAY